MADDQLAVLVDRVMSDPAFVERAQQDLTGTLAAEGITLGEEELAAVREFQAQFAGASPDQVQAQLAGKLADRERRYPGG